MITIDKKKLKLVTYGTDYEFSGEAQFDGSTVEEVIAEIKERLDKHGEFFHSEKYGDWGNKNKKEFGGWVIEIDDEYVLSSNHDYPLVLTDEIKKKTVARLHVFGGYWADYNYYIYTR